MKFIALAVAIGMVCATALSDDGSPEPPTSATNTSTLLLRFPLAGAIDQTTGQDAPWMPGLVQLFVDDQFVGHALMNSKDGLPKLSLASGDHMIRAEFQKSHLFETVHSSNRCSRRERRCRSTKAPSSWIPGLPLTFCGLEPGPSDL